MSHINVIPKPNKIEYSGNGFYVLPKAGLLYIPPQFLKAGELLKRITRLQTTVTSGVGPSIRLEINTDIKHEEGYILKIDEQGVHIQASTEQGLFYGVQTLRQLLPASIEKTGITEPVNLPYLLIEDSPRFLHRGFMLDVSRHFFGVDEVKRIIELLALLKINRFHWHLTDHQGWRIEIRRYPNLTGIGARRSRTQTNVWRKPCYDQHEVYGFYTQEQIREIIRYAQDNFIEIIPEIDLPGHSYAALASYPELSCDGQPVQVGTDFGFAGFKSMPKLVCAGKEETFTFFENVLDEIVELFPSRVIHLGSDEAIKTVWRKCPLCKARMKEEGLKSLKELQGYLINRLAKHLFNKHCTVVCWNDGLFDNAEDRIIVQHWFKSYKQTIAKVKAGRKAIISTLQKYYLDYSYKITSLRDTYEYEPQQELTAEEARNILGVEAPLWTEFVKTRDRLDWQMFPRLSAVGETAWTNRDRREYKDYEKRLDKFNERLSVLGVHYASSKCYQKYKKSGSFILSFLSDKHPADREYEEFNNSN